MRAQRGLVTLLLKVTQQLGSRAGLPRGLQGIWIPRLLYGPNASLVARAMVVCFYPSPILTTVTTESTVRDWTVR